MELNQTPQPNVTFAVFLTGLTETDAIQRIMDILPQSLESCEINVLEDNENSKAQVGFRLFKEKKLHATIIGLEGFWFQGTLYNRNYMLNDRALREMDLEGFLHNLAFLSLGSEPMFRIRVGGFAFGECKCDVSKRWTFSCETSPEGFHEYGRSPYHGSCSVYGDNLFILGWPIPTSSPLDLDRFPHDLYLFRRASEVHGILEKTHSRVELDRAPPLKPPFLTDHFHSKLGVFQNVPDHDRKAVESAMQESLSVMEPIVIDIHAGSMEFVLYQDEELEQIPIRLSLKEAIDHPTRLRDLYTAIQWSRVTPQFGTPGGPEQN